MKKIIITHSSDLQWKNELYDCLKTMRSENCEIILPQEDNSSEKNTKEVIQGCDFIVAEVSLPSTGQGIELGWANLFNKKIYCFYRADHKVSSTVKFIAEDLINYNDINQLKEYIIKNLL